jgi:hypothetical protein
MVHGVWPYIGVSAAGWGWRVWCLWHVMGGTSNPPPLPRNIVYNISGVFGGMGGQGGIKGRSPCRRRSRGFERSGLPFFLGGLLRSEAMRLIDIPSLQNRPSYVACLALYLPSC